MKIGSIEITNISKRFWFILAGVVIFIVAIFFMLASRPEPEDPLVAPAFAETLLPKAAADKQDVWFQKAVNLYGMQRANNLAPLTQLYSTNVGTPFRFKAYLPDDDSASDRPSLTVLKDGWVFRPAVLIDPSQPQSRETLDESTDQLTEGQPLMLGFPEGETPAPGFAYEFSGLLYWNSASLNPPTPEEEVYPTSPVLLIAGSPKKLEDAELEAPTTHRADIEFSTEWNGMKISIPSVEWSAGRGVRACVIMENTTDKPGVSIWQGLNGTSTIEVSPESGTSVGFPEDGSALANADSLSSHQKVVGYMKFDVVPSAAPTQPVILRLPVLNPQDQSGTGQPEEIRIQIPPDEFKNLTTSEVSDTQQVAGCSGTSASSTSTVQSNASTGNDVPLPSSP